MTTTPEPVYRGAYWEHTVPVSLTEMEASGRLMIARAPDGNESPAGSVAWSGSQLVLSLSPAQTSEMRPGCYTMFARAGSSKRLILSTQIEILSVPDAIRSDAVGPPDPGGGGTPTPTPETFTIRAGFVDAIAMAETAPEISATTAGVSLTIGPSTRGQYAVIVLPADHPATTITNTALGINVGSAYPLQPRTSGQPRVRAFGPVVEGVTLSLHLRFSNG